MTIPSAISEIEKKLLGEAFDENGYRHPLTSLLLAAADEIKRLRELQSKQAHTRG
jgi:hypothetical protein